MGRQLENVRIVGEKRENLKTGERRRGVVSLSWGGLTEKTKKEATGKQ